MEAIRRLVRKKKTRHIEEVEHQQQQQPQQEQQDHHQQQEEHQQDEEEEEETPQNQPPQQSQQWSQQLRENDGPYNDDGLFDVVTLDDFDYIRFTLSDMHGIGRCVSVPRRHVNHCLHQGLAFFAGILTSPVVSEVVDVDEVLDLRFGNARLVPKASTLRSLPWATGGKYRVGEFLCEMSWMPSYRDGAPQAACPRYLARRQLHRLDELGLRIYSAFEPELIVLDRSDRKPIFGGPVHSEICTSQLQAEFESFLYDAEKLLSNGGINIEKIHTELGPGQLEFVPQPQYGIESADTMFRLREGIKEICLQKGWLATFMAQPYTEWTPSGLHFNHSLWSKRTSKNAMYDSSQTDSLSDVTRWWVAGLLKHSSALMALCCPTVNCYRRLTSGEISKFANWGIDDRGSAIRVKNYSPKETYVENRMPSAAANPYLVMAATLAAGMDGIIKQLPCLEQRVDVAQGASLVNSLSGALQALQDDDVIKDALGEEFVRWFVASKTAEEVEKLKNSSLAAERNIYLINI